MKALKEKRVSLRSLFRRGLVILSILALVFAFASCSSSEEDPPPNNGNNGNNNGGGTVTVRPDMVVAMTVLAHPTMPSFEGAAPDLTGLKVMLTIEDTNGVRRLEQAAAGDFVVEPPVAYLGNDGTVPSATGRAVVVGTNANSATMVSPYGRYRIKYAPGKKYLNNATSVNVYIPAVIGMYDIGPGHGDDPKFGLVGILGEVYEDQPFDASGVEFQAIYLDFNLPGGPVGVLPDDLGVTAADAATYYADWPVLHDSGFLSHPVSSSEVAWKLSSKSTSLPGTALPAQYIYQLGVPTSVVTTDIANYYYVDKLILKETGNNVDKIAPIRADEPDFNGTATVLAKDVQNAWLQALIDADVKFTVVYYLGPDALPGAKESRDIGMEEYIRAMWTTDPITRNARASLPIPSGSGGDFYAAGTNIGNYTAALVRAGSNVVDSVRGSEYSYSLRLFYYNEQIVGGAGLGTVFQDSAGWPSAAIVPITENGKIWTYREMDKQQKANTTHLGLGDPEILAGMASNNFPTAMQRYYTTLQTYYDLGAWYENPLDNQQSKFFVIPWEAYTWNGVVVDPLIPVRGTITANSFDITAADFLDVDTREKLGLEITFDDSFFVGSASTIGIPFDYWVLP